MDISGGSRGGGCGGEGRLGCRAGSRRASNVRKILSGDGGEGIKEELPKVRLGSTVEIGSAGRGGWRGTGFGQDDVGV
jgi:hypothetical protein